MNIDLLLLLKKHTDTLIEKAKTKPQETLDLKLNLQMESFSFSPPMKFYAEGKRLLAVTSSETSNSSFNITTENKSFSISTAD